MLPIVIKIFVLSIFSGCFTQVLLYYLLISPAAYIQMQSKKTFTMESNTMNPDQTAPRKQSDQGL